jgi:predicted Zn-dependent peptidase
MKTAVDWLVDHLYLVIPYEERNFLEGLRKEALEKEKEQIIEAWIATDNKLQRLAAEEYYNQTYNQNK